MDMKYRKALNEVSQIFNLMAEEDREKIDKKFLKFVEDNKTKFADKEILPEVDLEEQDISTEAKAILYITLKKFLKD